MKKKLFRSFIVSLFVFTLFISVSNAAISSSREYSTSDQTTVTLLNHGYTSYFTCPQEEMIALLQAYKENPCQSTLDNIAEIVSNDGFKNVCAFLSSSGSLSVYFFDNTIDVGVCFDNTGNESKMLVLSNLITNYPVLTLSNVNKFSINAYKLKNSGVFLFFGLVSETSIINYRFSEPVKKLNYVTDTSWKWDGSSYYTQLQVPAGPEFSTELTDDEIASVVQNFSNSTYWKNREPKFTHFFIQRNEVNGNYAVYMVPYNLVKDDSIDWLYIPSGVSSSNYKAKDYDSYCILWHDGAYIPDIPLSLANLKYKTYLSPDGINFTYSGEVHVNELDDYRIPMTTPIIYSTFPLNFKTLLGDKVNDSGNTVDSFTEETSYDLSDLTNSETGESYVFEEIPIETDPVVSALREIFQELFAFIESLLNAIFDFSEYLLHQFGANAFTLIFAIVIEAFSALVAGISLLVRFAGFVLTLVAIPADSSLFNVLVDGSAWGTHFIEGLNFLKGLSWNNLNLWTFFECFVVAIEVIWTVKIVRRHYSQVV